MYQPENPQEQPPKRKFWQNLLIMDSGDLKKVLSLGSMMLSFLILFVYIISYILLMPLIERIVSNWPVFPANLAESIIPALIGTAAIMMTWPLFKDKRVLPAAFLWLDLFALIIFIAVLVLIGNDPKARSFFVYIFVWDVLPSLIIGNIAAWWKYIHFIRM